MFAASRVAVRQGLRITSAVAVTGNQKTITRGMAAGGKYVQKHFSFCFDSFC
jgi:hypothetical protein